MEDEDTNLLAHPKVKKQSVLLQFLEDPFLFYDSISLKFRGLDLNVLKHDDKMRKAIFILAIATTIIWFATGFDSGTGQWEWPAMYIWQQITTGQPIDWNHITYLWNWAYGKYMHWSVFPIYGLSFCFLSSYYSKNLDIKYTRNFTYSFCFILLSIGVFEWFWMISFYIFQNQPWILTWQWPQLRILMQNLTLTFVGVLVVLHIRTETYWRPRLDRKVLLLFALALLSCYVWIMYPFHVDIFSVETTAGTWSNTRFFPQTVYTVDTDPFDTVNAGEQFYIQNDLIHLVNTIAKVFVTLFFVGYGCITKQENKDE